MTSDEKEAVREMALDIKRLFIKNKIRVMHPEPFNAGAYEDGKYETIFEEAAKWCYKERANYEVFVNAQFRPGMNGYMMHPENLLKESARKNYLSVQEQDIQPQDDYAIQLHYLHGQLTKAKRKVENILMDDDIAFSAWFRILISTEPIQAVIDKYKEDARIELGLTGKRSVMKNPPDTPLLKFIKEKQLDYKRITE